MKYAVASILMFLAALCGCTSESGGDISAPLDYDSISTSISPPPPPPPGDNDNFEGIWQGVLTPDMSGNSAEAVVLVNSWGEFRMITDGAQFVGWPQRTGSSIAGTLTGIRVAGSTWSDGTRSTEFDLDGTISEDGFIEARYTGGGESGVIAVAWGDYGVSQIDSIVGTWVRYDADENIVATFQFERRDMWIADIHGSHADGCTYLGETEAWTSRSSYDFGQFEASGCPLVGGLDLNGSYSGTGALIELVEDTSEEPALVIALSNDLERQITFLLYRISE